MTRIGPRQANPTTVRETSTGRRGTRSPRTAPSGEPLRLRARGRMHTFSPLTLTGQPSDTECVVLVDTTKHLTGREIASTRPSTVRVGAGDVHGIAAGLPGATWVRVDRRTRSREPHCRRCPRDRRARHRGSRPGEHQPSGHTYGSLSNLVVSLTAVVWDQASDRYVARAFHRSHPDCAAFLTHIGRAFITDVTLRVGADNYLRCVSDVTTPASRLFAAPGSTSAQSFAAMVERSGRVETVWFPFTDHPWTKAWTVRPIRPSRSCPVDTTYNYPFSDNIPRPVANLASQLVNGTPQLAPALGALQYTTTARPRHHLLH
jgi:Cholesterol oxidase, substrate-binding